MEQKTCVSYNRISWKSDDRMAVEILPRDSHVSFYGKAHALFTPFYTALLSYGTPILMYRIGQNGSPSEFIRLYDGGYEIMRYFWGVQCPDWSDKVSPTTLRHIKSFCGMNKQEFMSLPYDPERAYDLVKDIEHDFSGWSKNPMR